MAELTWNNIFLFQQIAIRNSYSRCLSTEVQPRVRITRLNQSWKSGHWSTLERIDCRSRFCTELKLGIRSPGTGRHFLVYSSSDSKVNLKTWVMMNTAGPITLSSSEPYKLDVHTAYVSNIVVGQLTLRVRTCQVRISSWRANFLACFPVLSFWQAKFLEQTTSRM